MLPFPPPAMPITGAKVFTTGLGIEFQEVFRLPVKLVFIVLSNSDPEIALVLK